MDPKALWRHALEHWDSYTLPDLSRTFHIPTWDEEELLAKPWWWLRHHILALFGYPDTVLGATFKHSKED